MIMADSRFFDCQGTLTLAQICEIGKLEVANPLPAGITHDTTFDDVRSLDFAKSNHVTVLHNPKYNHKVKESEAGILIMHPDNIRFSGGHSVICTSLTPYRSYALVAAAFYPASFDVNLIDPKQDQVHSTAAIGRNVTVEPGAYIGPYAEIGDNAYIGANTLISRGVTIGSSTRISANVTISHSRIGNNCVIYPGARIGQAGFGFFMDDTGHVQVPQLGRVLIEDNVEIGANTTIDRGSSSDTIIGAGTRIDNLVQIAHNVKLGKGCVVVAQVGISGSTEIGDFTAIGGQAGLTGHLQIGRGVQIAAQSGVMRDIEDGMVVGGSPAVPAKQWHRQTLALDKLARSGAKG